MSEAATVAPTPLFHSPLGLFDFQADGVARTYYAWTQTSEPVRLALYDTGLGKTVVALALSALAFEDDEIDVVVVVADANKVLDWANEDTPKFTDLSVAAYAGAITKRRKVLGDLPQVLVTSWTTGRNDICTFKTKSRAIVAEGMLTEALLGKRVALVFDEFSAMRNRRSKTYIAWEHLVKALRRTPHQPKILGLTATPVENNPEDFWNAMRVLSPARAGRVEDFQPTYVASYDLYENPATWKNLTPAEAQPGVMPLNQMFAPITLRKRKTDPDVIDQFPTRMENSPTMVDLSPGHKRLYEGIEEIFSGDDVAEEVQRQGIGLLRLLAGHPMALLTSKGKYAREVVDAVGAPHLETLGSAKVDAMLAWQERMASQQTVIFSFYGQSVLPLLAHHLRGAGYKVSVNHGGLSLAERQDAQHAFKSGDTQIFLSSDAGAKGLNLGCGSGLLHYESPLLYSTFVQRSDRIHRIDSKHPSVTIDTLIAKDTIEVALAHVMLKRNLLGEKVQDHDYDDITGDPGEGILRAVDRLALLRRARS